MDTRVKQTTHRRGNENSKSAVETRRGEEKYTSAHTNVKKRRKGKREKREKKNRSLLGIEVELLLNFKFSHYEMRKCDTSWRRNLESFKSIDSTFLLI